MEPNQDANWQYKSSGATATTEPPLQPAPVQPIATPPPPPAGGSVSWTASEYIDHDRGANWYLMLAGGTLVLVALVYLITKDFISIAIIIILGILAGIFAKRRPRQVTYELNETGLKIGPKLYTYGVFKSFAVIRDEALPSINLEPLKRFMPPITIYFAAQDEEQITSALGAYLPYQDQKLDRIDRLSRHLKF